MIKSKFLHQLFVRSADYNGGLYGEMNGAYIIGNANSAAKTLFPCIRRKVRFQSIVMNAGGGMDGIHSSMEEITIFRSHFLSSTKN